MSTLSNEKTPYKLSKRTIQRRYHEKRENERVGKKSTIISKQKRLKRRIICRSHLHWNVSRDWAKVIATDEAQVVIGKKFGKRCKFGKRMMQKWRSRCLGIYNDVNIPQLSIIFWRCITRWRLYSWNGNITSRKYIENLDYNQLDM